jgi:ribonuclease BN (tRNA processing enzyme)
VISEGDTCVWLDAGAATLAEFLRHLGLVRNLLAYGDAGGGHALPVLGPPGWREWFDVAVPDPVATRAAFEMHDLLDRGSLLIGDLRLTPFAVSHGIPTFGCRAESDHGVLAYSSDSGPCDALAELARNADLFVCESFVSLPGASERETVMTPEQAGSIATAANARSLLLTHLHPDADPATTVARARATFGGPVEAAEQGMFLRVR